MVRWAKRLLVMVLLLAGAVWAGYVAAFNWWAAGGPPSPHPETYELRGNIFFGAALLLLAAFVGFVVRSARQLKRRA